MRIKTSTERLLHGVTTAWSTTKSTEHAMLGSGGPGWRRAREIFRSHHLNQPGSSLDLINDAM